MNSFAERFVRSIKEECLNRLIFIGEESLRIAIAKYIAHYHEERNHQGKDNLLLFPETKLVSNQGKIQCCKRLNGMLKYYYRSAA
ncbi:transposase [bacterium]|nr:transposase [bacterium]